MSTYQKIWAFTSGKEAKICLHLPKTQYLSMKETWKVYSIQILHEKQTSDIKAALQKICGAATRN